MTARPATTTAAEGAVGTQPQSGEVNQEKGQNQMTRENTVKLLSAVVDAALLHEGDWTELERLAVALGDGSAYGHTSAEEYGEMVFRLSVGAIKLIASARSAPPPSVEVERLREALEPFARAGSVWDTSAAPDTAKVFCDLWDDVSAAAEFGETPPISDPEFTVGDFRRARAALSRKQEPGVPTPGGEG